MSSTRHAPAGSPLRQERWASSPEIECGLKAALVARRCSVLSAPRDRELIWSLHYFSRQPGGLDRVAAALTKDCENRVGPRLLREMRPAPGQCYSQQDSIEIYRSMARQRGGEAIDYDDCSPEADRIRRRASHGRGEAIHYCDCAHEVERGSAPPIDSAQADELIETCRSEAYQRLADDLAEYCLNPKIRDLTKWPWYWDDLASSLREYVASEIKQRQAGAVVTKIGEMVGEVLDYTHHEHVLTLIEGDARTGKSHAARAWCEAHPGSARFIDVPPSNADTVFYRALARGLGLGSFQNYRPDDLRARVESVLLTGDILICLDEAHWLWPQAAHRDAFPHRINWLMAMREKRVPICCIATPQFLEAKASLENKTGWNGAQLIGRIDHYKRLPATIDKPDLAKVARALLPGADADTTKALVIYACTSARYLAAIETIARRANYLANRAGRNVASAADADRAMAESVIPSDRNLADALRKPVPGSRSGKRLTPMQAALAVSEDESHAIHALRPACAGAADMPQDPRNAPEVGSHRGGIPATTGRNNRPVQEDDDAEVTTG